MKINERGFITLTKKNSASIQTLVSDQQKNKSDDKNSVAGKHKNTKRLNSFNTLSGYDIAASTLMMTERKQTLVGPFSGKSWQGRLWRTMYSKIPLTNRIIMSTDQFSVESIAISVKLITRDLEANKKFTDECINALCKTKKELDSTLITIAKLIDSLLEILQTDNSKSYRVKVCALIRKPDGTFVDTGWSFPKLLSTLDLAFRTDHKSHYEVVKLR